LAQLTSVGKSCVNILDICCVYKEITKGSRVNDNNTFTEYKIYDDFLKQYDIGTQYGTLRDTMDCAPVLTFIHTLSYLHSVPLYQNRKFRNLNVIPIPK
jgi:hypothetical protein